jgi:hypothetical protein
VTPSPYHPSPFTLPLWHAGHGLALDTRFGAGETGCDGGLYGETWMMAAGTGHPQGLDSGPVVGVGPFLA